MADFALTTFTQIVNENPVLNSRIPADTMTDLNTIKALLNTVDIFCICSLVSYGSHGIDISSFIEAVNVFLRM